MTDRMTRMLRLVAVSTIVSRTTKLLLAALLLVGFLLPVAGCSDDSNPTKPMENPPEMVMYWPFSGNASDGSGHGNDGVVHGAALAQDCQGQANSAYDFNGSSAHIEAVDAASLRVAKVSVAMWVLVRGLSDASGYDTFLRKQYGGADASYELGIRTADGRVDFSVNRGSSNPADGIVTAPSGLTPNQWHHLVGTYDGSALKLYVDGDLVATEPYTQAISYNGSVMTVGAEIGQSTHWVDGKLDDVRVYDGALEQAEIQDLASACTMQIADLQGS